MRHYCLGGYEILPPPYPLEFDEWSRQKAQDYLNWFVAHVPERAAYVLEKSVGMALPEGAIPPEVLLDVWAWFLRNAKTERVPQKEIEAQRKQFGHFGSSFVNERRWTVKTEYMIRDVAMLMSAVFTTNYPILYWDFDSKPKRYIFFNQPVLKGFLNLRYGKPFADVFQPVHMVTVQASDFFRGSAQPDALYNLFLHWRQDIPSSEDSKQG